MNAPFTNRFSLPFVSDQVIWILLGLLLLIGIFCIRIAIGDHPSAMGMDQFCHMLKQYSSRSFCPLPYHGQF